MTKISDFRNLKISYFFDPFLPIKKHSKTGVHLTFALYNTDLVTVKKLPI